MSHVDWTGPGYDLAFLQNAFIASYRWADPDADSAATDASALAALQGLAELWAPSHSLAELRPPGWEEGAHETLTLTADEPAAAGAEIARQLEAARGDRAIAAIGPALEGWTRIAVPAGADAAAGWTVVSDEGIVLPDVEVRAGVRMAGHDTVWLRVPGAAAGSDVSVFVDGPGGAAARLTLGASVFAPGAEPRSPEIAVRGVARAEWQAAAARLVAAVEQRLAGVGWRPADG